MQITLKTGWMVKDNDGLWIMFCQDHPFWWCDALPCWDSKDFDAQYLKHGEAFDCDDPWPNHPNGGPDCILNISEMYKGE